jgi:hypothetical protein
MDAPASSNLEQALELYCDRKRILQQAEIARHLAEGIFESKERAAIILASEGEANSRRFLDALLRDV